MHLKRAVSLVSRTAILVVAAAGVASAGENVLYNYQGGDGCAPYGGVISDPAGNLYGTTYGDRIHFGTVYELTAGSGGAYTQTVLHTFQGGVEGRNPVVGLVRDAAGNLYGTTPIAGTGDSGTVFEMTPGSDGTWTMSTIYGFSGGDDGAIPYSPLVIDAAGNLYGTTSQGGSTGNGVVYKLTPGPGGWTYSVLYTFNGSDDGSWPVGTIVLDTAGNLYGTTSQAGADGWGTVFKLAPGTSGWTFTLLHTFTGNDDGADSEGGLTIDSKNILYGTTNAGGSGQSGVVFQMRPNVSALPGMSAPWMETVLHAFTGGDDGAGADRGVVADAAGNLNGSAEGGSAGFGIVYRMTPSSTGWSQNVLYTFSGGDDGRFPESRVMVDSAGTIWGTTIAGGTNGCGVAYEVTAQ